MIDITTGTITEAGLTYLTWTITDTAGTAAWLHVEQGTRMVMAVEVRADRRGEGLARELYETAYATGTIYHAPVWGCTPEGAAFAEAVGGEVMDDETASAITGCDLSYLGEAA